MTYREALEEIAKKHNGVLRPADVVEEARSEKSPLHNAFEWDDGVAAEAYRIEQAERLIRVQVTVIGDDPNPVRAFVNLKCHRGTKDGGYRILSNVLNDLEMSRQLEQDAATDLLFFQMKYSRIEKLREVFAAAEAYRKRLIEQEK